jgi:hypothetical protein
MPGSHFLHRFSIICVVNIIITKSRKFKLIRRLGKNSDKRTWIDIFLEIENIRPFKDLSSPDIRIY